MSDEKANEQAAPAKRSKGRLAQTIVIVVLMVGEGVAVFFVANAMGPDPELVAADSGTKIEDVEGEPDYSEIALAECRPSNRMSGKLITLHLKVTGLVVVDSSDHATELAESRQGRILDRVQFVVRSAEIQHLNEPGLDTIKRRLKTEFDRIFNDPDLIEKVLIPVWQQSGSGV